VSEHLGGASGTLRGGAHQSAMRSDFGDARFFAPENPSLTLDEAIRKLKMALDYHG
jgi:hypothetical protein